jgi:hypothetical protein
MRAARGWTSALLIEGGPIRTVVSFEGCKQRGIRTASSMTLVTGNGFAGVGWCLSGYVDLHQLAPSSGPPDENTLVPAA